MRINKLNQCLIIVCGFFLISSAYAQSQNVNATTNAGTNATSATEATPLPASAIYNTTPNSSASSQFNDKTNLTKCIAGTANCICPPNDTTNCILKNGANNITNGNSNTTNVNNNGSAINNNLATEPSNTPTNNMGTMPTNTSNIENTVPPTSSVRPEGSGPVTPSYNPNTTNTTGTAPNSPSLNPNPSTSTGGTNSIGR